jgi:hypothetical protein
MIFPQRLTYYLARLATPAEFVKSTLSFSKFFNQSGNTAKIPSVILGLFGKKLYLC